VELVGFSSSTWTEVIVSSTWTEVIVAMPSGDARIRSRAFVRQLEQSGVNIPAMRRVEPS